MPRRPPRHKQARRLGFDVHGTGSASLARRLATPPGGRRAGPRRRASTFGRQLLEKQKARAMYGVGERQFRRTLDEARRVPGPPGENLLELLERRLDNVVYRLGFARTRAMARQLISHGHVRVDGQRVTVPSYRVREDEGIALDDDAALMPVVAEELASGRPVPEWLDRLPATDAAPPSGRVRRLPRRAELDAPIDEALIVAFYAR